ncbi:MAG: hypothetical protein C5B57_09365 [Blastocatellia bacterium]|nr:MAG: hypothetical protein C5B57_09365 [Blastocatellia bacterium]
MTRRSLLWAVLTVMAIASAAFSWRYFTRAFPLLSIDIKMDRQTALARARALTQEHRLGPVVYRDAASFSLDESVQSFVELEGGGKQVFAALVADRLYAPYRWKVRHFTEREKHEATFSFAPDGTVNGFTERLREDAPGAAVSPAAARQIAETTAALQWGVDLARVAPVEQSQERRPGGRVDHTFVYERPDARLGEGRYRLRLVVSGDTLTEVAYFVKIPDAFLRRYEGMRSVNMAIGIGASLAFLVLYGGGGIAFGLFILGRQRWVIWRQPIVWGAVVAIAQTAARLNEWPLTWIQYDTALSTQSFVIQQAALALAELAVNATLFSLSFMAAESLTRRAFPNHPQFWRIWDRQAGRSSAVLGRTIAGYLLVPAFLAYDVALYLFATKSLGWWTPSEALFNPDVLAAYVPWFSAIARSFQAGFWEESLFRAVPIAGAALIGDRLGHRRLWITLAFIVQAIIFGAGHAPYPTQPAYARPVELILPSIGFGLLYLRFGLLPGIILHFAFDSVWFALPIFAATAPGIRVQQITIVLMVFVPLWVVMARRLLARSEKTSAVAPLNATWQSAPIASAHQTVRPVPAGIGITRAHARGITGAGVIAAGVWLLVVARVPVEHHALHATRSDALRTAHDALGSLRLDGKWRFLPVAETVDGGPHRFVWNTVGSPTYRSLLGTYLNVPEWNVFVRTFQGDIAERAESWTVHLDSNAVVQRVTHEVPESRPGPSLEEASARQMARRALGDRFRVDAESLSEVSAVPSKLPMRTDWLFTFADRVRTLPQGELRLSVHIIGDEVADTRRFVFVPEDWERSQRNAETIASVVQGSGILLSIVIALSGAIAAIVSWSRRRFAIRLFLAVSAALLCVTISTMLNGFPSLMAALSTSQPLQLQIAVLLLSSAVGLAIQSTAAGLVAGALPTWAPPGRIAPKVACSLGLAVGTIGAAASAASSLSSSGPHWPSDANASTFIPFLNAALSPVAALLARMTLGMLSVAAADRISTGWTCRRWLVGPLLVIVGGVLLNTASALDLRTWVVFALLSGGLLLTAYVIVLRHDIRIVPVAAAVIAAAATLREGWARAYPGALAGAIVAIAIMSIAAYAWFRALSAVTEKASAVVSPERANQPESAA